MSLVLHLWLAALCVGILAAGTRLAVHAAVDCHRRGLARVHRGQSWCPCRYSVLDHADGRCER